MMNLMYEVKCDMLTITMKLHNSPIFYSGKLMLLLYFYSINDLFIVYRSQELPCHLKLVSLLDQLHRGWMIS